MGGCLHVPRHMYQDVMVLVHCTDTAMWGCLHVQRHMYQDVMALVHCKEGQLMWVDCEEEWLKLGVATVIL